MVQVSADSIYDEKEKPAYFTVIVETGKSYLKASGHALPITPGMMTNTQIITGRKSILTYLLKPVLKARSDALTRALSSGRREPDRRLLVRSDIGRRALHAIAVRPFA